MTKVQDRALFCEYLPVSLLIGNGQRNTRSEGTLLLIFESGAVCCYPINENTLRSISEYAVALSTESTTKPRNKSRVEYSSIDAQLPRKDLVKIDVLNFPQRKDGTPIHPRKIALSPNKKFLLIIGVEYSKQRRLVVFRLLSNSKDPLQPIFYDRSLTYFDACFSSDSRHLIALPSRFPGFVFMFKLPKPQNLWSDFYFHNSSEFIPISSRSRFTPRSCGPLFVIGPAKNSFGKPLEMTHISGSINSKLHTFSTQKKNPQKKTTNEKTETEKEKEKEKEKKEQEGEEEEEEEEVEEIEERSECDFVTWNDLGYGEYCLWSLKSSEFVYKNYSFLEKKYVKDELLHKEDEESSEDDYYYSSTESSDDLNFSKWNNDDRNDWSEYEDDEDDDDEDEDDDDDDEIEDDDDEEEYVDDGDEYSIGHSDQKSDNPEEDASNQLQPETKEENEDENLKESDQINNENPKKNEEEEIPQTDSNKINQIKSISNNNNNNNQNQKKEKEQFEGNEQGNENKDKDGNKNHVEEIKENINKNEDDYVEENNKEEEEEEEEKEKEEKEKEEKEKEEDEDDEEEAEEDDDDEIDDDDEDDDDDGEYEYGWDDEDSEEVEDNEQNLLNKHNQKEKESYKKKRKGIFFFKNFEYFPRLLFPSVHKTDKINEKTQPTAYILEMKFAPTYTILTKSEEENNSTIENERGKPKLLAVVIRHSFRNSSDNGIGISMVDGAVPNKQEFEESEEIKKNQRMSTKKGSESKLKSNFEMKDFGNNSKIMYHQNINQKNAIWYRASESNDRSDLLCAKWTNTMLIGQAPSASVVLRGKGVYELVDYSYGSEFQALYSYFVKNVVNFVTVTSYHRFWLTKTGELRLIIVNPTEPSFHPEWKQIFQTNRNQKMDNYLFRQIGRRVGYYINKIEDKLSDSRSGRTKGGRSKGRRGGGTNTNNNDNYKRVFVGFGQCESCVGLHLYRCFFCGTLLTRPLQCGMTLSAVYCSKECQANHWQTWKMRITHRNTKK
ncbi:hypothetical protein M0812_14809 [Anaeramoeba flamelloides]|uniref:MYND-type domain-containing protein n=1 Tax=Anaeramoeba flamelloides TaxID=1746091 RepID=A0AAV7ZE86_9EUKA|nr:hypothetical protein M0812_14809 [Anaeramoeba flamelloides]